MKLILGVVIGFTLATVSSFAFDPPTPNGSQYEQSQQLNRMETNQFMDNAAHDQTLERQSPCR